MVSVHEYVPGTDSRCGDDVFVVCAFLPRKQVWGLGEMK
jgi:hypothetical protein